eukprot:6175961-Pleurochrysis_carterae.AAC.1
MQLLADNRQGVLSTQLRLSATRFLLKQPGLSVVHVHSCDVRHSSFFAYKNVPKSGNKEPSNVIDLLLYEATLALLFLRVSNPVLSSKYDSCYEAQ